MPKAPNKSRAIPFKLIRASVPFPHCGLHRLPNASTIPPHGWLIPAIGSPPTLFDFPSIFAMASPLGAYNDPAE